jgi:putative colanic acid biosynthesis UDP-glucose lipid carrier transferase
LHSREHASFLRSNFLFADNEESCRLQFFYSPGIHLMIAHRTRGLQSLLIISQVWLLLLLYWIWFFGSMTINQPDGRLPYISYSVYCFWLLLGLFAEWLNRDKSRTTLYELSLLKHAPVAWRQTVFAFATLLIYLAISKDRFISRAFLFSLLPAAYFLLLWTNHALPEFFVRYFFGSARAVRTLLVGSRDTAEKLRFWLERKSRFGFQTVGVLTNEPANSDNSGYPVLGTIDSIEKVIEREKITQVILLNFLEAPGYYRDLIDKVQALGVRTLLTSNIEELLQRNVSIFEDDGCRLFTLHEEPLENPLHLGLKRIMDLGVAIPVILLFLPFLCVLFWIAHRIQSPGPLFHRQTRAGIQNREFTIIKFRTMHEGHAQVARQATANDPRIFPAGRWLRRLGLDEFPQFLNVLRGEMSVVGPRPHLIEHNVEFARLMAGYHLRAFVKPGITGLAQVRGFRGEANTLEDIQARLQSDMAYLENWSVPLDVAIILRTIWQIGFPESSAR